MVLQNLKDTTLDEHESRTTMAHFDDTILVSLSNDLSSIKVHHICTSKVLQVFLPIFRRLIDAVPVHFLLGVDATDDILVSRQQGCYILTSK